MSGRRFMEAMVPLAHEVAKAGDVELGRASAREDAYAIALIFEWGRADWTMWLPTPAVLDRRKLRPGLIDDPVRQFWDPWLPEAWRFAPGEEIEGGIGMMAEAFEDLANAPGFEDRAEALLQLYEEAAEAPPRDGANVSPIGLEDAYAVEVARQLNSTCGGWRRRFPPEVFAYPYSDWSATLSLVAASLPPDDLSRVRDRGVLPQED